MNPGSAAVWMSTLTVSPSTTPLMIPVSHVCSACGVMALEVDANGDQAPEEQSSDRDGDDGTPDALGSAAAAPLPPIPAIHLSPRTSTPRCAERSRTRHPLRDISGEGCGYRDTKGARSRVREPVGVRVSEGCGLDQHMAAITAEGLVKVFPSRSGEVRALDGVDLEVPTGSVLGLLGPNGAGKTTTVRILTTLLTPDAGRATVDGFDVAADPQGVRRSIGLSGQYAAVDEHLTGRENLVMVGRLYHFDMAQSRARATELLEQFDLAEAADRPAKTYSGGMRRRLDLAGALVARPPMLFLDEPTTGLDPRSRMDLWEVIEGLVAEGTTVLLTTQYLDEADKLADPIAVIDHGRVIAQGTADELKAQVGGERLAVTVRRGPGLGRAARSCPGCANGVIDVDEHSRQLVAPVAGGATALLEAVRAFDENGRAHPRHRRPAAHPRRRVPRAHRAPTRRTTRRPTPRP